MNSQVFVAADHDRLGSPPFAKGLAGWSQAFGSQVPPPLVRG